MVPLELTGKFLNPNPQTSYALYALSKQNEAWPENGVCIVEYDEKSEQCGHYQCFPS